MSPRSRRRIRPEQSSPNGTYQKVDVAANGLSSTQREEDIVRITHTLSVDAGTGSGRATLRRVGGLSNVSIAQNGTAVPSAIFVEDDRDLVVGEAAVRRGSVAPQRLIRNFKTLLPTHFDTPLIPGGPTPVECYVALVDFIVQSVFTQHPDLKALHDSRARHFSLVLAIPSTWGSAEMNRIRESLEPKGIHVGHFVNEPSAIAEEFLREVGNTVQFGDIILVLDLGHGTFDINAVKVNTGYFDAILGATGDDDFGSKDVDLLVARTIAERFLPAVAPAFAGPRMDLTAVSGDPSTLRLALAVARTAAEIKEELTHRDIAKSSVDDGSTSVRVTLSIDEFNALMQPFFLKACAALQSAITGLDLSTVNHFVVGGGGGLTRGLKAEFARALGIPTERFHVMTDTTHVVANGAANAVQRLKEGAQTIPKGLALTVQTSEGPQALLLCNPEQVIPPGGIDFSLDNLKVRSDGKGTVQLVAPIGELGHGVAVSSNANGTKVLVPLDQIAELGHAEVEFEQLPMGVHDVQLNVSVSRSRAIRLGFSLLGFPDRDVQYVDVGTQPATQLGMADVDIVLIFDNSGSMSASTKIAALKESAQRVVSRFIDSSVRIAMVTFGGDADLVFGFDAPLSDIQIAIDNLTPHGGTPMTEALALAATLLSAHGREHAKKAAFVVTDGQPNAKESAAAEAARLKAAGVIVCTIGIGADADRNFLVQKIASAPSQHFNAANAHEAVAQFESKLELLIFQREGGSK